MVLKDENSELKARLSEITIPTATQIYQNPENIEKMETIEDLHIERKRNEKLVGENANLKDMINIMDEVDDHKVQIKVEKTSDVRKKKDKIMIEPTSLTMRVKQRTQKDDRKPMKTTPQMNTRELEELHMFQKRICNFRWETKYSVVSMTNEHIKGLIEDYWSENKEE